MSTLCLCCGGYYDPPDDCPNVDSEPHSGEIAAEVAFWLIDHDLEATPERVWEALRDG